MEFKTLYSNQVAALIDLEAAKQRDLIFVILGDTTLLNSSSFQNQITDSATFLLNGNEELFNDDWMRRVLTKLYQPSEYHVLSYPQYIYFEKYFTESIIKSRVVVIKDNLRGLYPIKEAEYLEQLKEENIDERPDKMPMYQMEQMKINGQYYCTLIMPTADVKVIDVFTDAMPLKNTSAALPTIDIDSDQYALDCFINSCIANNTFDVNVSVKMYSKKRNSLYSIQDLEKINYLLSLNNGALYKHLEEKVSNEYIANKETISLLCNYWGKKAKFRKLKVYESPDLGNNLIEISQGAIVDTIINEYNNAQDGTDYRDLFLTAPTGAGKSLLFQLPAFYVAERGDVTIVISPLIALMKDQVHAIIEDRKFHKVAFLNSELNLIDRDTIIQSCKEGHIDILYMSPELFMSYSIEHFIGQRQLGLMVIDEAHLITTWGRDFRVDYWFLGNHINKIRKYYKYNFPMVAVTATAIYGGDNDMVFDSIDSLVMQNPHIYIGQVKRNNIQFIINNYNIPNSNYKKFKINQTAQFIESIQDLNLKTLVYAPFTSHINEIALTLEGKGLDIATRYYGSLPPDLKEKAFKEFKNGDKNTMISTKAFGMGVDIADIQIVYHHAPSGLLPDYVQEIGRVARDPKTKGYAILNYSSKDNSYSKALHGMSALRTYQIKAVIKKIYNTFLKNNKSRNLLLSVDDFSYIFDKEDDIDQKVLTALMMIEKDYLEKHRFNVVIARPKKLLVKVYARLTNYNYALFTQKYRNVSTIIQQLESGYTIIELNLDKLWMDYFRDKGFPSLKRAYYLNKLFANDEIEVIPQLKMSFQINYTAAAVRQRLSKLFITLQQIFARVKGKYFTEEELADALSMQYNYKDMSIKIARFILSSFGKKQGMTSNFDEPYVFLQKRIILDKEMYRTFNNKYIANFANLLKKLDRLYGHSNSNNAERFITNKGHNALIYIRLGSLIELLNLGSYEVKGGESPLVYLRINDPNKLMKDANNDCYQNRLLDRTLQRHELSMDIFNHFFLRDFSNRARWNYIEDFFLGSSIDTLIDKYQGKILDPNKNKDIPSLLSGQDRPIDNTTPKKKITDLNTVHKFEFVERRYYAGNNLLTLKTDKGVRTCTISEWVVRNPTLLHHTFYPSYKNSKAILDKEMFCILLSKVKNSYPEYYKKYLGSNIYIDYGSRGSITAKAAYKENPVKFYKWWLNNKTEVYLTFKEKLSLFLKVYAKDSKALRKSHKEMVINTRVS